MYSYFQNDTNAFLIKINTYSQNIYLLPLEGSWHYTCRNTQKSSNPNNHILMLQEKQNTPPCRLYLSVAHFSPNIRKSPLLFLKHLKTPFYCNVIHSCQPFQIIRIYSDFTIQIQKSELFSKNPNFYKYFVFTDNFQQFFFSNSKMNSMNKKKFLCPFFYLLLCNDV